MIELPRPAETDMQGATDQLLRQLEKLTVAPQLSGLAQLDDLPKMIVEHLKLEAAGLKLFYFLNRNRRSLRYPANSNREGQLSGRQLRAVLDSGRMLHSGALRVFPLVVHGRNVGVLWLAGELAAAQQPGLARVVQLLGSILEGTERNFVHLARNLTLISRQLHAADSIAALVAALGRGLLRYNRTLAVALRPIYGNTVFGGLYLRIIPGLRKWQADFRRLEEDYPKALQGDGNAPVLELELPRTGLPPDRQPKVLFLPLRGKQRQLGVLTLIGGDWVGNPAGGIDLLEQEFLQALAEEAANCLEQHLNRERVGQLLSDRGRKLRENALLYRISRAIHSTLRLDELSHLILSALTVPDGGGFERAFLFLFNERSQTLQGVLGVSRDTAQQLLPEKAGLRVWDATSLSDEVLQLQRQAPVNRRVLQQKLALADGSALARAVVDSQVVLVGASATGTPADPLASALELSAYACVPLVGKSRCLGGLVVDNHHSDEPVAVDQVRFLELFATLAASAVENSMLLSRLERAHQELIDTQEKLLQGERLAVLGEMSASVAHELKNPLVSIGGFARRLARLQDSGPLQQEYAEIIARETSRMEEMLSQILAFSRKQILCLERCAPNAIVDDALEVAGGAIQAAGARLEREIDDQLPMIDADPLKLRQVLVNLIINACEVTAPGGIIRLRTRPARLRGAAAVAFEVEDAGGGMAPEVLRNIFNPFFTTKQEGTGLGLPICQRIIDHHRGEIEVYNTDAGARFTVLIPVGQNGALRHDRD